MDRLIGMEESVWRKLKGVEPDLVMPDAVHWQLHASRVILFVRQVVDIRCEEAGLATVERERLRGRALLNPYCLQDWDSAWLHRVHPGRAAG